MDINKEILKLRETLVLMKDKYTKESAEHELLTQKLQVVEDRKKIVNSCAELLQTIGKELQENTTKKIEEIVTKTYRYVFQNDDSFVIKTEIKNDSYSSRFYIKTHKDGKDVLLDPIDEDGGGKVDVISFGLRLAALLLYRPVLEKVLIFDEPLKFLSSGTTDSQYKKRAAELLKKISEEYKVQIIVVTHDEEFIESAHNKIYLEKGSDGYTKII